VEPDTSTGFVGPPSPPTLQPPASGVKAWRYAYDDNGDLVGTSDARGCGENYYYDTGGRLVAEDYSPCLSAQPPYSAPTLANGLPTGDGTEAFYLYDSPDQDSANITCPPNGSSCFPFDSTLLLGRLVTTFDRGAKTALRYDGRGRVTGTARRLVAPGTPADALANRYTPHRYVQTVAFDGADRPTVVTTGVDADLPGLLDSSGLSYVTSEYSKRNIVSRVGSGYGPPGACSTGAPCPLIRSVVLDADGLAKQTVYGDVAGTQSAFSYDGRRRLSSNQT
jgi:YD repeat-containing protein